MKYDLYEELYANLRVEKKGPLAPESQRIYEQIKRELDLKPGFTDKKQQSLSKKINTQDGEKKLIIEVGDYYSKTELECLRIGLNEDHLGLYIHSSNETYPSFEMKSQNGGMYFWVSTKKGSILSYYDVESIKYIKEQYGEDFDDWNAEDDYDNVFSKFGIVPDMKAEFDSIEEQIHLFTELVKIKPEYREKYIRNVMEVKSKGRNK